MCRRSMCLDTILKDTTKGEIYKYTEIYLRMARVNPLHKLSLKAYVSLQQTVVPR